MLPFFDCVFAPLRPQTEGAFYLGTEKSPVGPLISRHVAFRRVEMGEALARGRRLFSEVAA